ncbi:cbb3-type cytochrome oxidase subunit 3 [Granulosicoccus sp. 3-233]|uniref:cbb3-type cytochrome oxidase subunit 3 n=1 Tax=Granulosicoccus sp. 3-233 TaxID=3417969 RepID=UPI003D341A3F
MGITDMRVIVTVVSFVVFLLIVLWAYSGRQKKRFDEAANLPFADDDMQEKTVAQWQAANENMNTDKPSASQSAGNTASDKEASHG